MSNQANFFTTTLAQSLSDGGSDTEIFVNSIQTPDGQTLTTADFSTLGAGYLTIDPQSSDRVERIKFTGVSSADVSFTGATRGLLFVGGAGSSSSNAHYHSVGATVVISFGADDINDIIQFIADTSFAGTVNATTSIKGIIQLPTQPQVDAGTATGSTGASLVVTPATLRAGLFNDYVADTGAANAYVIAPSPAIVAYAVGQVFSFTATHTNTGASTINVNALGTKNLFKVQNGSLAALVGGEILVNQIVQVEYDGTQFQVVSPLANTPLNTAFKFGGTGADGALTITSGTTTLSLGSAGIFVKNYSSISITGTGKLAFSNPATTGTLVILKCSGNVTLTSSTAPMIDASNIGAAGASANNVQDGSLHSGSTGTASTSAFFVAGTGGVAGSSSGGAGGALSTLVWASPTDEVGYIYPNVFIGAGGGSGAMGNSSGSGTATAGVGGAGGGGLIIECNGSWNFTTASGISVGGTAGGAGSVPNPTFSGVMLGQGGGGGSGGYFLALYNTLTANTGTVTVAGGAGGAGAVSSANSTAGGSGGGGGNPVAAGTAGTAGTTTAKAGGAGANGFSLIILNTYRT